MDHNDAVKMMAPEKYLLDELDSGVRDEFEEHFFCCHECAQDVQSGVVFMQQGKDMARDARELELQPVNSRPVVDEPRQSGWADWFSWLRPAFAVPAFALLLAVIGFQNLVQLPALKTSIAQLNSPEVLPSAYLASGTARGGSLPVITARQGEPFLLEIDIPENSGSNFIGELYDSAGNKKWSVAVPTAATNDTVSVRVPGGVAAGNYTLVVRNERDREVVRYAFEVKRP